LLKYKLIAIDFDGTIVEEAFPELGALKPHAKRVMQRIRNEGGRIAIWTARNKRFDEAIQTFLKDNDIPFDVYNDHFPENKEKYNWTAELGSPKIFAEIYIDDRGYGVKDRHIDWLEVERHLFGE
jgi:hydroxymethylpyrimidine pyrophosphatase-like HAD family hydrolase